MYSMSDFNTFDSSTSMEDIVNDVIVENLAEDFRDDQFDEDDEFHFNNILMIAEKELFPETPLCQMCDCTDLMCVCAIKCPIYRRFHR